MRKIETILAATDGSAASSVAVEQAIQLATCLGARLIVLNVVNVPALATGGDADALEAARDEADEVMRTVVDAARREGVDATYLDREGQPGEAIVAAAASESADMIVVGSHGRSVVNRLLLGSVSEYVVQHAGVPVLVARAVPGGVPSTAPAPA